jgi:hypothetical protein
MNRISEQFHALFGIFMVMFYLGIGIFALFFGQKYLLIDKPYLVILGSTFILYGSYRIFTTYRNIRKAFFEKDDQKE